MKKPAWLSKMACPRCRGIRLTAMPFRPGRWGAWGIPGLRCPACRENYPVVEGGILRMIPRGDYSRYAHWEKLHSAIPLKQVLDIYSQRWVYPDAFLLTYYRMAALTKKMGWKFEDSVELGCGWGSYSLFLQRFGLTRATWLLDISVSALKATLKVFSHFKVQPFALQGEIHNLPFRDRAFDVSLSGGLYEHFVGDEQQELVKENCRISRRVLCQVPESSTAYWLYRRWVTWRQGKWPFGFEVPLSRGRMRSLLENSGASVKAWDYHNLASAALMSASSRREALRKVSFRPPAAYLLRHDLLVAAETGTKPA